MKMKHVLLSTALLLAGYLCNAQAQIRGGVNLANISVTDDGGVNESRQLSSFQAGVLKDFKLGSFILNLQTGLLYTGKGAKVENGTQGQSGYYKTTFNPRYLEVPVNFVFKAPLGGANRIFVGAGPYAAIGIGGKIKAEGTSLLGQTYSVESGIEFSDDDPTTFNDEEGAALGVIRRFDYGLNGSAGIETKNFLLGVNYGLGLAKLQSGTDSDDDSNNKHRVLSFTLGFKF